MANLFRMRNLGDKDRVARLAAQQAGLINASQLTRLMVPRGTISRWCKTGYLHPVLPTVYAVGHAAHSIEADHAAAILYSGEGSMLSHETGVWWWGFLDKPPRTIHVSTARRRASRRNVRVHERRNVERVWRKGLPVTTVAQTLLDYAVTAPFNRLRYVVAEAEYFELLDLDALIQIAGPGKPGSKQLRAAIEHHMPQLAHTRSEAERLVLPACVAAGVPLPDEVNGEVEGSRADFVWHEPKVVVEVDGRRGHVSRARMVRDRRRDLKLRAAGYIVLRYTWDQLTQEIELVMADIKRALGIG
jgi:hypothetical protein